MFLHPVDREGRNKIYGYIKQNSDSLLMTRFFNFVYEVE